MTEAPRRARRALALGFMLAGSFLLHGCGASRAIDDDADAEAHGRAAAARSPKIETAAANSPVTISRTAGFATAADGARIYYERVGIGPAVVLIHGLGGNHAVWYKQVPLLARAHTVIVYSQRGFAPSQAGGGFDVAVLVEDLMRVLDAAGVSRAAVVGQSMGGWTALGAALRHPERVSAVVLADTIGGIFDDEIHAHYRSTVERARELSSRPPPLGRHPALDPTFTAHHPDEAYLYQLLATFGAPSPAAVAQALGATAFSHVDLVRLQAPVLFVVGENDPIFPVEIVRRAAAYVLDAPVAVIARAGHSPYFERPETWYEAVSGFLDGHRR